MTKNTKKIILFAVAAAFMVGSKDIVTKAASQSRVLELPTTRGGAS